MSVAMITHNGLASNLHDWSFLKSLKRLVIFIAKTFLLIGVTLGLAGILIFIQLYVALPDPTSAALLAVPESTRILDRHGNFLYEVHGQVKRIRIPLTEIPLNLQNATIVLEDKDFYQHYGFDATSILRALKANLNHGEIRQGASTITQQLARIAFLDNQPTYSRKLKELVLAVKVEQQYSKDEILEMYLNNIPYGSNAYGIEAASNMYFDKPAKDLDLLESVYLAALPKAPSLYSPYGPNIEALHQRARSGIEAMREQGYISELEAKAALGQGELKFKRIPVKINAPHFVFYVLDALTKEYGEKMVQQGGMIVYTSLDLDLQHRAEKIISEQGAINEKKYGAGNAALVALDPRTGEILAMVGSRDYFKPGDGTFNVAISPRQPGSSFKPYVYVTAMTNGLNPATMLMDVSTNFANDNNGVTYIPKNYSGRNYGPVSIRQALAGSLNIPAVKTLVLVGIDKSIDTAEKLGLTTLKDRKRFGPSLVLGGAEVKLVEHTAGLGALGNGGIKQPLSPILKITDTKDNTIYRKFTGPGINAVDAQAAYLINSILSDTQARRFIFGRNKNLEIPNRQVAVKTGTTQDFRDAWTVGYTPSLAVGVWVGNNDNSPMRKGADGSVVAAPIWKQFMEVALTDKISEGFVRPPGIVELSVDKLTGKLPIKFTPSTKKEIFASYNVPTEKDNAHVLVKTAGVDINATSLRSEKPDDALWEAGAKSWVQEAGLLTTDELAILTSTDTNTNRQSPIIFNAPELITDQPWEVQLETRLNQIIESTEILVDGKVLIKNPGNTALFENSRDISSGIHNITARIQTIAGDVYTVNRMAEFAPNISSATITPTIVSIVNPL